MFYIYNLKKFLKFFFLHPFITIVITIAITIVIIIAYYLFIFKLFLSNSKFFTVEYKQIFFSKLRNEYFFKYSLILSSMISFFFQIYLYLKLLKFCFLNYLNYKKFFIYFIHHKFNNYHLKKTILSLTLLLAIMIIFNPISSTRGQGDWWDFDIHQYPLAFFPADTQSLGARLGIEISLWGIPNFPIFSSLNVFFC